MTETKPPIPPLVRGDNGRLGVPQTYGGRLVPCLASGVIWCGERLEGVAVDQAAWDRAEAKVRAFADAAAHVWEVLENPAAADKILVEIGAAFCALVQELEGKSDEA